MMVSPDNASEMACPMVLQAVVGDKQLFVSFPFPPFTYHVVLAKAAGARAENRAKSSKVLIVSLCFIIFLLLAAGKNVVAHSGTSGPRQSGRAVPYVQDCPLGSRPCAPERSWCAIQRNWQSTERRSDLVPKSCDCQWHRGASRHTPPSQTASIAPRPSTLPISDFEVVGHASPLPPTMRLHDYRLTACC